MKRYTKICTILLMLILAFLMTTTALASGISFDGDSDEFIFIPGTEDAPTNLFPAFQNVMPGDVLQEQILVKNDTKHQVKIKVYLRSKGAQEDTQEFLSQMKLTVKQNGDSVLFQAPADETATLTDWVCLGTIYSGGEIILDVTLEVPITMGNEFLNKTGYVDWQFMVEEFPVEKDDPKPVPGTPATGDTNPIGMYVGVAAVSLVILVILILVKNKKQEEIA